MKLEGAVESILPGIPKELQGKLIFAATYKLNEREAKLFNGALQAIVQQLQADNISFDSLTNVNAIFTDSGDISLNFKDGVAGTHLALAIYAVGLWDRLKFNEAKRILVFIEELCHHYWRIEDEIVVKYKVHEIFSRFIPGHKIEDLFNMESLQ